MGVRGEFRCVVALWLSLAAHVYGQMATQYWDTAADPGLQGGSGTWSVVDATWAANAVSSPLSAWTDGNVARFDGPSNGVASLVTLSTTVSVAGVQVPGSLYTLLVTNGGQMISGAVNSIVGDGSTGNVVIVTGTGSAWDLGGKTLTVGSKAGGVSNTVIVGREAVVSNATLIMGNNAGGAGNRVMIDGATFLQASNLSVSVGEASSDNTLILTNGARFTRLGGYTPEQSPSATRVGKSHNNLIRVETNCVWDNGSGLLYVGANLNVTNSRLIIDGGAFTNIGGLQRVCIGGEPSSGMSGNSIVVTNGGLIQWGDRRIFYIAGGQAGAPGSNASFNTFVVTDGGKAIGSGGTLHIASGTAAWSNSFIIARGGSATNIGTVTVGMGTGAWGNQLVLDGGTLYTKITADYPGNTVDFRGGLLQLTGISSFSNGVPLVVGDGIQVAVLNGWSYSCTVPMGMTIAKNGVLAGMGPYHAPAATSIVYGTVSPGLTSESPTGMVYDGSVTFMPGSAVRIEIASTNTRSGYDRFVVTNGLLSLGGMIKPVLMNGFVPSASDRFPYVCSNSVPLTGLLDGGKGDGARIPVYSNNFKLAIGTFRLGVSTNYVVLDDFKAVAPVGPATVIVLR